MRLAVSILLAFTTLVAAASDYFEPKLLTGSIYDKPEGQLLFTFRRTATQTGDIVRVLREFHDRDRSLAAQERVLYERGRLVRFELDELQIGASGHARIETTGAGQRVVFEYKTAGNLKRNTESVREAVLISDMLPAFVVSHWEDLNRGAAVKLRYLVVPRLETIGFKLSRESTGEFQGKKVVRIKMEPTSWLIAQILDPLLFTVELDPPHRILQYRGRTTPKMRVGESWRDLDALTVFDWH
jgi:hypothetical protein